MAIKEMPQYQFKLVAVGDANCGKESLLDAVALPRVYETPYTVIEINNTQVILFLNTISCLENHALVRRQNYHNIDVVFLCFSIGNPESLRNIEEIWMPEVQHFCPEAPVVLVGNKMDLRNDQATIQHLAKNDEEPVETETGKFVAEKIGAYYTECSVLHDEGVERPYVIAALASMKASTQKVMDFSNCINPSLLINMPADNLEKASSNYYLSSESLDKYMTVMDNEEELSIDTFNQLDDDHLPSEYWDDIMNGPSSKKDDEPLKKHILDSELSSLHTAVETLDITLPHVNLEFDSP